MKTKNNFYTSLIILAILTLSFTLNTRAQNYLINFTATGTATTLDSIKVENLTLGTSLTILGSDILHLTSTLGINNINANEEILKIYPNPMQGQAELLFYAKQDGEAQIAIYDIWGKVKLTINDYLSQGEQKFKISGLNQGMYFININAKNYFYTLKLLSQNTIQSDAKITHIESSMQIAVINETKSTQSTIDMQYNIGNTLRFTGYSSNCYTMIIDVPTMSKTITFIYSAASLPTLTSSPAINITWISATSGGNITSDGGCIVTARGICYSTSTNPTIANSIIVSGSGLGSFTANLTGLTPNITYYVRAFAINNAGTAYGDEINFMTLPVAEIPTLTTTAATSITVITATSGGNVINDGGATITARGVCWSTSINPTTANNITTDGTGTGGFISSITGLTMGTTYYARAYATNSVGTAYGNELSFVTLAPPTITTTAISSIDINTAISGGNIVSDGGATISARGVCWSTSANPTIANNITTNGTGIGTFISSISGLTTGITYYVRAYATNIAGTAYGNQLSFTTLAIGNIYQGGILAYILQPGDPGFIAGQTHGLIAAPSDQNTGILWHSTLSGVTGAIATAIGTGNANTNAIIAAYGTENNAAKFCADLVLGGYSDWYLPSKDELNKLYINRVLVGGFVTNYYWSSSESDYDANYAWKQAFFSSGIQVIELKTAYPYYVRAIRAF